MVTGRWAVPTVASGRRRMIAIGIPITGRRRSAPSTGIGAMNRIAVTPEQQVKQHGKQRQATQQPVHEVSRGHSTILRAILRRLPSAD
jgi:hypothetical protein